MDTLYLDGTNLELDVLFSVLEGKNYKIEVTNEAQLSSDTGLFHIEESNLLSRGIREKQINPLDIPRTYAVSYGKTLPKEVGKISLILLLNSSIKQANNLRKDFISRILDFINYGIYPCIHEVNNNELSAMSELALILSGEKGTTSFYNGEYHNTDELLKELNLEKLEFNLKEVAFITKLCCVSVALSIQALREAKKLAKTADICIAMNLEGIRGETGAFDKRLHELARPFANQIISAENTRRLLENSEFTTEEARITFGGDKGARCQDAISYRATPQTHGGVRDTIQWLEENLKSEINDISYRINPLIGYSLDLMTIALADLGNISERRSFRLNDSNLSYGLPMNLVGENPGFNHGFPVIQAAATAVLAELKLLALPSTSSSIIDGRNDGYNCTTYSSAQKTLEAMPLLTKVLAIEMLMTAQAMDLAKDKLKDFKFGKGTTAAIDEFRKYVEMTRINRFAVPDMVEADRLVAEAVVLDAVEKAIGRLK
ncbi:aromatic amino acid ammonia-lyase [Wukongibacter baidiensis]|uniref:aromatic amino acid ammonia-lyase n=1 Tax=Wukongibacter baidiensis TaxID=1723361 RepID=UPI003D7F5ABA